MISIPQDASPAIGSPAPNAPSAAAQGAATARVAATKSLQDAHLTPAMCKAIVRLRAGEDHGYTREDPSAVADCPGDFVAHRFDAWQALPAADRTGAIRAEFRQRGYDLSGFDAAFGARTDPASRLAGAKTYAERVAILEHEHYAGGTVAAEALTRAERLLRVNGPHDPWLVGEATHYPSDDARRHAIEIALHILAEAGVGSMDLDSMARRMSPMLLAGEAGKPRLYEDLAAEVVADRERGVSMGWPDLARLVGFEPVGRRLAEIPGVDYDTATVPPRTLPAFPVEALIAPGIVRFVREAARSLGLDPAMVALPALAAFGVAVGTTTVVVDDGQRCYPKYWTAVQSGSGTGKSPAEDLVLAPYRIVEAGWQKLHALAMETYKADLSAWKADQKRPAKDRSDLPEPSRPIQRRLILQDVTLETMLLLMQQNPRGLLLAVDELKQLFSSLGQYKSGGAGADRSALLRLRDHRIYIKDRVTNDVAIYLDPPMINIIGGIVPANTPIIFGKDAEGMAGRFGLAIVDGKMLRRSLVRGSMDPATARAYAVMVEDALALPVGEAGPVEITLDGEARALHVAAVNTRIDSWEASGGGTGDDRDSVIGKRAGHLLEVALIVHMMRCTDRDDRTCYPTHADRAHLSGKDPAMTRIDGDTMRGAVALVNFSNSHMLHALDVAEAATGDGKHDAAWAKVAQAARALQAAGKPADLPARQLLAMRVAGSRADLDKILASWEDQGRGSVKEVRGANGKPGTAFRVEKL